MKQRWQLLQPQNAPELQSLSAVVKVMTLLSSFNQWEFSISGEIGNSLFSKVLTAPLFLSVPTPYPVKSSVCAGVQFSRDSIRAFNYPANKNTRTYRALSAMNFISEELNIFFSFLTEAGIFSVPNTETCLFLLLFGVSVVSKSGGFIALLNVNHSLCNITSERKIIINTVVVKVISLDLLTCKQSAKYCHDSSFPKNHFSGLAAETAAKKQLKNNIQVNNRISTRMRSTIAC